jgi:hypothetical protein
MMVLAAGKPANHRINGKRKNTVKKKWGSLHDLPHLVGEEKALVWGNFKEKPEIPSRKERAG